MPFILLALTNLAACQHRDATDTVADWWHSYEGGEIAKLRPPAPGQNLPYPHVGRTPSSTPELPSPEARMELTETLEEQRNIAHRETAADGVLPENASPRSVSSSATPGKPAPSRATASTFNGQSSTTILTAGQPDQGPTAINPTGNGNPPPATQASATQGLTKVSPKPSTETQASQPEAELPPVTLKAIPPTPPGQFPTIGDLPPPPPAFPGFDIPSDAHVRDVIRPDFDVSTPDGTLIRFRPTTDQVLGNPLSDYEHIAAGRKDRRVIIRGFGDAMSADVGLSSTDQAREVALGLLRARTVAQGLMSQGIPPNALLLRAEAVGDGVRLTYAP